MSSDHWNGSCSAGQAHASGVSSAGGLPIWLEDQAPRWLTTPWGCEVIEAPVWGQASALHCARLQSWYVPAIGGMLETRPMDSGTVRYLRKRDQSVECFVHLPLRGTLHMLYDNERIWNVHLISLSWQYTTQSTLIKKETTFISTCVGNIPRRFFFLFLL